MLRYLHLNNNHLKKENICNKLLQMDIFGVDKVLQLMILLKNAESFILKIIE